MKYKFLLLFTLLTFAYTKAQTCTANFSWYENSMALPVDTIVFVDNSINATTWHWDFGDNTTSTLQSPVHSYSATGLYTVYLIITDGNNCSDTLCDSVFVSSCATELFYAPTATQNKIKFFDTPTNSPYFPTHWHWDFGDQTTSNQRLPVHTYSASGIYHACLTAFDSSVGCIYTSCKTIHVKPQLHTKISVCNGNWSNPNTWNTGSVPGLSDSVLIYNNVILNVSDSIASPGVVYIEENSSLCGHDTLISPIFVYGNLNVDFLNIIGNFSYTDFIPVNGALGVIVSGNWLSQYFPSLMPFNCSPGKPCATGINSINSSDTKTLFTLRPNPTSDRSVLEFENPTHEIFNFTLYNMCGQAVSNITNINTNKITIDKNDLPNGIYFFV